MIRIKPVLLWISAGVLLVCLGVLSTIAGQRATAATPTMSSATNSVEQPARSIAPTTEQQCGAQSADQALSLDVAALTEAASASASGSRSAACPAKTVHTCCRCGGCGCRPTNISPTNWCAC